MTEARIGIVGGTTPVEVYFDLTVCLEVCRIVTARKIDTDSSQVGGQMPTAVVFIGDVRSRDKVGEVAIVAFGIFVGSIKRCKAVEGCCYAGFRGARDGFCGKCCDCRGENDFSCGIFCEIH